MACIYSNGWDLADNCLDNIGGVQNFLISNYSGGTTYEYDTEGVITGSTGGAATWYEIEQRRETANFSQTHALNIQNGTNVYTQNASMTFHKYQASVRDLVYTMAQTETNIIVLTQEGKYFLLGQANGMNAISSEGGSGQSFEDMNGMMVTFEGKEKTPAREVSSTFIAGLTVS